MDANINIGGPYGQFLSRYAVPWSIPRSADEPEMCPICQSPLGSVATYDIKCDQSRSLILNRCPHAFHQCCLEELLQKAPTPFLQCPICRLVYGTRTGTRPLTGTISHQTLNRALQGYEKYNTIQLTFNFYDGVQGSEHPNPGRRYRARGFPRKAYLPDSPDGQRALHGIYLAWENRLMFTVGQSLTTARTDVITYNDIHLKTMMDSGIHGYPDPTYLITLFEDLNGFGITEAAITSHMTQHPNLRQKGGL